MASAAPQTLGGVRRCQTHQRAGGATQRHAIGEIEFMGGVDAFGKEPAILFIEKAVTPLNCVAQRLLTRRDVARCAFHLQPERIELGQHGLGGEQFDFAIGTPICRQPQDFDFPFG